MPKRNSIREIPSPEIQGEDSWVKVKPMTYGEQKAFRVRMRELEVDEDVQDKEAQNAAEDARELEGCRLLAQWVVDWNWVDEEDKPLPKPEGKPEVINDLLDHEVKFLIATLSGDEGAVKN